MYDEFLKNLFGSPSNLTSAVEAASIQTLSELENEVSQTCAVMHAELSRIVDFMVNVSGPESVEFLFNVTRVSFRCRLWLKKAKYIRYCSILKTAGGPQYYRDLSYTKWNHRSYGWNILLENLVEVRTCLNGGHYDAFFGDYNQQSISAALERVSA